MVYPLGQIGMRSESSPTLNKNISKNQIIFMEKYIIDEKTGIHYTLVGEIYIPNLVSADTNYEIGM